MATANFRVSHINQPNDRYAVQAYTVHNPQDDLRGSEVGGLMIPLGAQVGVPNCQYCKDRTEALGNQVAWGQWGHSWLRPADPADATLPNPCLEGRCCEFCFHFSAITEDVRQGLMGAAGKSDTFALSSGGKRLSWTATEANILWVAGCQGFNRWACDKAIDPHLNAFFQESADDPDKQWTIKQLDAFFQAPPTLVDLALFIEGLDNFSNPKYRQTKRYLAEAWRNALRAKGVWPGDLTMTNLSTIRAELQ